MGLIVSCFSGLVECFNFFGVRTRTRETSNNPSGPTPTTSLLPHKGRATINPASAAMKPTGKKKTWWCSCGAFFWWIGCTDKRRKRIASAASASSSVSSKDLDGLFNEETDAAVHSDSAIDYEFTPLSTPDAVTFPRGRVPLPSTTVQSFEENQIYPARSFTPYDVIDPGSKVAQSPAPVNSGSVVRWAEPRPVSPPVLHLTPQGGIFPMSPELSIAPNLPPSDGQVKDGLPHFGFAFYRVELISLIPLETSLARAFGLARKQFPRGVSATTLVVPCPVDAVGNANMLPDGHSVWWSCIGSGAYGFVFTPALVRGLTVRDKAVAFADFVVKMQDLTHVNDRRAFRNERDTLHFAREVRLAGVVGMVDWTVIGSLGALLLERFDVNLHTFASRRRGPWVGVPSADRARFPDQPAPVGRIAGDHLIMLCAWEAVGRTLHKLHRQDRFHRDLRPDNVMIKRVKGRQPPGAFSVPSACVSWSREDGLDRGELTAKMALPNSTETLLCAGLIDFGWCNHKPLAARRAQVAIQVCQVVRAIHRRVTEATERLTDGVVTSAAATPSLFIGNQSPAAAARRPVERVAAQFFEEASRQGNRLATQLVFDVLQNQVESSSDHLRTSWDQEDGKDDQVFSASDGLESVVRTSNPLSLGVDFVDHTLSPNLSSSPRVSRSAAWIPDSREVCHLMYKTPEALIRQVFADQRNWFSGGADVRDSGMPEEHSLFVHCTCRLTHAAVVTDESVDAWSFAMSVGTNLGWKLWDSVVGQKNFSWDTLDALTVLKALLVVANDPAAWGNLPAACLYDSGATFVLGECQNKAGLVVTKDPITAWHSVLPPNSPAGAAEFFAAALALDPCTRVTDLGKLCQMELFQRHVPWCRVEMILSTPNADHLEHRSTDHEDYCFVTDENVTH